MQAPMVDHQEEMPFSALFTPQYPFAIIDCVDNLRWLSARPDASVDLIVTSPPYNIGKAYEKKSDLDAYIELQARVITECVRVLKQSGSICWQVGNHVDCGEVVPLDLVLYQSFKEHGLKLRNRIVWHFEHGLHCTRRLSGRYETIMWFTKSDSYKFLLDNLRVPSKYPNKKSYKGPRKGLLSSNPLGKNPGDVWIIPNVKHNHVEKTLHPCQFPVELVERLVLGLTDVGDIVMDPYAGVGSSIIAAIKNFRQGIGCDLDPEYVKIANERISLLHSGKLRLRSRNKEVYVPPNSRE